MRNPLIVGYKDKQPVNLYLTESFSLKGNRIFFNFTQNKVEWFFEDINEAKLVYDLIVASYVRDLSEQ